MSTIAERLNVLLGAAGLEPLNAQVADKFGEYISLLLRWNARMNLTAVRDEEGILSRHIIESIAVSRHVPVEVHTLLDFGSGAGLPGIPVALCRSEIVVTLAESQGKKAAFLQEAVRVLKLATKIHAGRAEALTQRFDCVTMRAVDRMAEAVAAAARLVKPSGWLALMTSEADAARLRVAAGTGFSWREPLSLPGGDQRILILGQQLNSTA
ncbi:MAG TPA: 16S rRNA (guanine(527)-N(7))-methyltransferase RsmG [Terracidiphilus sp.]|nr:16S rRNA (guanine(527)-N(7))-methyltransferase RsmG [Terracidiphilus sp.]